MTISDWAFVAGFWQGEGTAYHYKCNNSSRIYVVITQTDESSIIWLKRKIKVGYVGSFKNKSHLGKKRVYQWRLNGLNAVKFLKKIKPFLTSAYKKEQIKRVLKYDKMSTNHKYNNHAQKYFWKWH